MRLIVALGAVLVACAGTGSLLVSRSGRTDIGASSPFPVGDVFKNTEWTRVETALSGRGLGNATVVSGDRLQRNGRPFALVRATSRARGVCFVPVRGTRPGPATCTADGHLASPLLVFGARDRWGENRATFVVGVVRHSVVGVSMVDSRGYESGVALLPGPGGLRSFAGGYGSTKLVVRARLASGRIVAERRVG
jgi:hypothetical protein